MWEHFAVSPSALSCTLTGSKSPSGTEQALLVKTDPAMAACSAVSKKRMVWHTRHCHTLTIILVIVIHFGNGGVSICSEYPIVTMMPDRALEGIVGSFWRLEPKVLTGACTRGLECGMTVARCLMNPGMISCMYMHEESAHVIHSILNH